MVDRIQRLAINGGRPVRKEKLPLIQPYLDEEDARAVAERVRAGWVSGDGEKCHEFEAAFASWLGVKHVLLTTSCTAALELALMALRLEEGSEVIVPDYTYTSTALAPLHQGLQIKFCDVKYETANLDPDQIERLINKKTRAIVPVDYAGHPCEVDRILEIAEKHGLFVVQDAAQAIGAKYKGELVGRQALITCFSFNATKNLVTGEGGCVVTNDKKIATRVRIARDRGVSPTDSFEYLSDGNSYVLPDILGALALSQFKKLACMNKKRAEHAAFLNSELAEIPRLELPYVADEVEPNWHIYAIRVPAERLREIKEALNAEGIGCNIHYRPLHSTPFYQQVGVNAQDTFPNATRVAQTLLRLPIYPQLTESDLTDIVRAVKKVTAAYL